MIPYAINNNFFEDNIELYKNHLIVIYCTIGYRSGIYTLNLMGRGFNAKNLIGGVLLWAHNKGLFLDKDGTVTNYVHVYGKRWSLLPKEYTSVY